MKHPNQVVHLLILISIFFSCSSKTKSDPSEQNSDTTKIAIDSSNFNSEKKSKKGEASLWLVNPASSKINFTIKNFGKDVDGTLSGLKATINFDPNNLEGSNFEASVQVNTINTGNTKRDKDLMHPKYLDGEKYPEITFKSDTIIKSENGFEAKGNLTIKGKSLRKDIPFTFEVKENTGIFKSQFMVERLDYGIGGDGPIMGKDINVSLEVAADKQ